MENQKAIKNLIKHWVLFLTEIGAEFELVKNPCYPNGYKLHTNFGGQQSFYFANGKQEALIMASTMHVLYFGDCVILSKPPCKGWYLAVEKDMGTNKVEMYSIAYCGGTSKGKCLVGDFIDHADYFLEDDPDGQLDDDFYWEPYLEAVKSYKEIKEPDNA